MSAILVELAARVVEASVAGGLLALVVWLLVRAVPAMPANLRVALWWLVGARFLVALAGLPAIELPVLPGPVVSPGAETAPVAAAESPAPAVTSRAYGIGSGLPAALDVSPPAGRAAASVRPAARLPSFAAVAAIAWAGLALLGLGGALRQAGAARRLVSRARRVTAGAAAEIHRRLGGELGVRAALLASAEASGAQAVGLLRPAVVVAERDLEELDPSQLEMTLAHELVHLRRRDLWWSLVPALAERLFAFHPLARLAAREYALAREAACDAAVMARLQPPPAAYARLILRAGIGRHPTTAAALGSGHPLKRRLQMLESTVGSRVRPWAWIALPLALAAALPYQLAARQAPEADDDVVVEVRAVQTAPSAHLDTWIYLAAGGQVSMSGSSRDVARAERLRSGDQPLLWARHDGEEWVVRDPAMLERLEAILGPQRELGRQQAELGAQQAELGSQQAALGERQAALGAQQAQLGSEQARLAAEMARLAAEEARLAGHRDDAEPARRQALRAERREIEARMGELGRRQGALGRQQGELGEPQGDLGRQQGELGRRQGELGRRQAELARQAEREILTLLERAIADGTAERVRR